MNYVVNGVLNLNKPIGITSNIALQKVKYILKARKAGHCGNLDFLATGVLPICFGEATKFSRFLLDADKVYQVKVKLGLKTNTFDSSGEIIGIKVVTDKLYDNNIIFTSIKQFEGISQQVPPMFSSIKQKGKPLYKFAKKGICIQRQPRTINVHQIDILKINKIDNTICMKISCSKGTYIRSLINDWGNSLGCYAHIIRLHRIKTGNYKVSQSITLQELYFVNQSKILFNVESLVSDLPLLSLSYELLRYIRCGKSLKLRNINVPVGLVSLWNENYTDFIGIAEILSSKSIIPKRFMQI